MLASIIFNHTMLALLKCRRFTSHFMVQPFSHSTKGSDGRLDPVLASPFRVLSSLACGKLESAIAAFLICAIWFIGFIPPVYTLLLGTLTYPHLTWNARGNSAKTGAAAHRLFLPAINLRTSSA
ncbi:hypothetical protein BJ165DRAFT_1612466 [Panaeolus papilionaceus]|nr:hypothetical protein BJ165DRAFT_1612466 [Panaeolus papilionaceus]